MPEKPLSLNMPSTRQVEIFIEPHPRSDSQPDTRAPHIDASPNVRPTPLPLPTTSPVSCSAPMASEAPPTIASSLGMHGVESNTTVPSPHQPTRTPYTYIFPDGPPNPTVVREIRFIHPGYPEEPNVILRLSAYDALDATRKGIHAGTARLCCAIIACNAWAGTLKTENGDVQDDDTILLGSQYYFHVDPPRQETGTTVAYKYPICPSF